MSITATRVAGVSFRARVWCTLAVLTAVLYLWAEFLDDAGVGK